MGSILARVLWNKRTQRMNIYIFLSLCLSLPLTFFLLTIYMLSLCVSLFHAPSAPFSLSAYVYEEHFYGEVEVNVAMVGYEQEVHKSSRCYPLITNKSADLQYLSNSQKCYR